MKDAKQNRRQKRGANSQSSEASDGASVGEITKILREIDISAGELTLDDPYRSSNDTVETSTLEMAIKVLAQDALSETENRDIESILKVVDELGSELDSAISPLSSRHDAGNTLDDASAEISQITTGSDHKTEPSPRSPSPPPPQVDFQSQTDFPEEPPSETTEAFERLEARVLVQDVTFDVAIEIERLKKAYEEKEADNKHLSTTVQKLLDALREERRKRLDVESHGANDSELSKQFRALKEECLALRAECDQVKADTRETRQARVAEAKFREEVRKLRMDAAQQDRLISGFQKENTKLYQDLSTVKEAFKEKLASWEKEKNELMVNMEHLKEKLLIKGLVPTKKQDAKLEEILIATKVKLKEMAVALKVAQEEVAKLKEGAKNDPSDALALGKMLAELKATMDHETEDAQRRVKALKENLAEERKSFDKIRQSYEKEITKMGEEMVSLRKQVARVHDERRKAERACAQLQRDRSKLALALSSLKHGMEESKFIERAAAEEAKDESFRAPPSVEKKLAAGLSSYIHLLEVKKLQDEAKLKAEHKAVKQGMEAAFTDREGKLVDELGRCKEEIRIQRDVIGQLRGSSGGRLSVNTQHLLSKLPAMTSPSATTAAIMSAGSTFNKLKKEKAELVEELARVRGDKDEEIRQLKRENETLKVVLNPNQEVGLRLCARVEELERLYKRKAKQFDDLWRRLSKMSNTADIAATGLEELRKIFQCPPPSFLEEDEDDDDEDEDDDEEECECCCEGAVGGGGHHHQEEERTPPPPPFGNNNSNSNVKENGATTKHSVSRWKQGKINNKKQQEKKK